MRTVIFTAALAISALCATPASADVRITIDQGRVTLSASNATPSQILAEWARVGQTRIINAERVPGGPLTLEFTNVPERQALDVILRAASGYVAATRVAPVANASQFDRIMVMPTSSPARPAAATPAPTMPTFQQPQFTPPPIEDEDDDAPAPPVPPNAPPTRAPAFGSYPVPQPATAPPQGAPAAAPTPTAPVGVSTPGMVVPAPAQPGQQPGQPGAPLTPDSDR